MKKHVFGLVGRDISYSFSKRYFTDKFSHMGLVGHSYQNFDLQSIKEFKSVLERNPDIKGLNVTIPYKEEVIPYLDAIDEQAKKIGAVNTIQFTDSGIKGFNTDTYGFQNVMLPFLKPYHTHALILGTGGASKAVAYVLGELGISYKFVSRSPSENQFGYKDLTESVMQDFKVIINCTPLGTHPDIDQKPDVPYSSITDKHFLFDLIYNPEKTAFLKEGEIRGASITNGLRMLQLQADRAWEIWEA